VISDIKLDLRVIRTLLGSECDPSPLAAYRAGQGDVIDQPRFNH
jgi:hypothetical protein